MGGIEKYRGENVTADSQRQRELAQLEERREETQEQAAWYQHKHEAAVKRVDQLKVTAHAVCPPTHQVHYEVLTTTETTWMSVTVLCTV